MPNGHAVISWSVLETEALGELLLVADSDALLGVYFVEGKHAPAIESHWQREPNHLILKNASRQLAEYLAGKRTVFDLPLRFEGTAFQRAVWTQIGKIRFGQTITYAELAGRAGNPKAIRAAGSATGKNPLSLIIPCHRVVATGGGMGGYAGGLQRKSRLLAIESSALPARGAGAQEFLVPSLYNAPPALSGGKLHHVQPRRPIVHRPARP